MRGRGAPDRGRGGGYGGARGTASTPSRGRGGNRGRGSAGGGRGVPAGIYSPPNRPIAIDARLRDGSQKQVMAGLKSAPINEKGLPLRLDLGTKGREIALRTNYFAMTIPKGPFYDYEVVTTPAVSIRRVRRRIFEIAEDTETWKKILAGCVAHDHSAKLVASKLLPQPLSIDVPFYEEDDDPPAKGSQPRKMYTLTIKFGRELETESLRKVIAGDPQYSAHDIMPIISAFNLILAAWPTRSGAGGVMVGRNKFFMPGTGVPMPLGGGLEAVRGFYSSVRTAHQALMVNVNVCTTAFYRSGNLATALIEFLKINSRPTTFVKGLRVKATHLGYRKTIKEATEYTAKTYVFKTEDFGEISVEEYFLKRYKIKLQHPNLPLVDVGGQKVNYLPTELCEILPNQPYRGKLLDEHTAAMIRYAAQPPNANAHAIETQGLKELGFTQNAPTLNAFGVGISQAMATVPGRVVPPPKIKYKGEKELDGRSFRSDKASWNLREVKFVKGATLAKWAVLLIRDGSHTEFNGPSDPELRSALKSFSEVCGKSGLNITSLPTIAEVHLPPYDRTDSGRGKAIHIIHSMLPKMFNQKPQIIFTILSNTDKHIYSGLKRLFDVTLDLPSVCAQAERLRNGGPQYYSNVSLKFNMKLGGVNHVLDKTSVTWLGEMPTMVVGIDVTHPGVMAIKGTPSIAAVVASVDRDCVQFPASLRRQESRKEMVTDLKEMMIERLNAFHSKSGRYPERILIYRDGVSEGQFASVIEEELPAVVEACRAVKMKSRPKLTIVVCAKRHHTRFFPTSEKDVDDKFNPLPGTVVDQGVTTVYNFDFYLQAHGSLQGSSKPTHYFVIHDENGFIPDKLQALTNSISYMFARATKAVSLVSPAYYADLASVPLTKRRLGKMPPNTGGMDRPGVP
ncbi:hypothetical protein Agabi119p4_8761 [Agaricus bisporus var. burnettii]|uniref:Piwi domain-containing protein n=1 Tax=Agaricus bisporus var. burnettii TaxID=192524 RepID=A0A8H7C512_AGABI|nr:hypothetical protein Agabi119p4_8761 [Agaricus bisporus var. burnettii]